MVGEGRFPAPHPPEGLGGPASALPWLGLELGTAQERALAQAGAPLGRVPGGRVMVREDVAVRPEAIQALLARGRAEGRDLRWAVGGRLGGLVAQLALGDEGPWLVYLHGGEPSPERLAAAPAVELDPAERHVDLPVPRAQFGVDILALPLSDRLVLPAGHWLQLLWANLLGLGPHLWRAVVGEGAIERAWRLSSAAGRALSLEPAALGRHLVRRGRGCRVHPSAVVEGCWLGEGVEIGAQAVVRGSVLAAGARVEELAIVEMSVLSAGARVQRQALFKFSLAAPGAAAAGAMQLGVLGRDAAVKYGAVFMDMAIAQGVGVRARGAGHPVPFGVAGVCVGDRSIVGTGVQVAPGRALPPDLVVLAGGGGVITRVPEGLSGVVRVQDGTLVALS